MADSARKDLYISLDQGGHATRAMVFDGSGEKWAEHACPIQSTVDGPRVEIDPAALIGGLWSVIDAVFEELGADTVRIKEIGLATQRSNIVCWHKETREPLSPVLSWQDRRAPEYLAGLDHEAVHRATGLFPNAHYGASKLAWCLENFDAVKRAGRDGVLQCGPMASLLASGLTGAPAVTDPVNGSRTLLLNLSTRDWDPDLCRHFGIDAAWLPPCVGSRHGFGHLAADRLPPGRPSTGVLNERDPGLPLTIVTGDLSAAAFARGAPRSDTLYITIGTGAFLQRVEGKFETSHPRLLNGMLWHDGSRGLYSLEGTVNGAGSALSWFAEAFHRDVDALVEQLHGYDPHAPDLPLFLNGVSGLGSPFWCPDFESRFVGEADTGDKVFAVLESVIFLLMKNYEAMDSVTAEPARIVVSGGLSNNDGLCRGIAGLAGRPVVRGTESEGTAKGLAYLLAHMPDSWSVEPGATFKPESCRALRKRYSEWSELLENSLPESREHGA